MIFPSANIANRYEEPILREETYHVAVNVDACAGNKDKAASPLGSYIYLFMPDRLLYVAVDLTLQHHTLRQSTLISLNANGRRAWLSNQPANWPARHLTQTRCKRARQQSLAQSPVRPFYNVFRSRRCVL